MNGKTHAMCGITAMAFVTVLNPTNLVIGGNSYIPAVGLATAVLGATIPDIDIETSRAGRKVKLLSKLLTHRGFTHTLAIPSMIYMLMHFLAKSDIPVVPSLLLGILVGWLSHVVADLFNKKGVPLFWPLLNKKVHIATFTTGTWQETAFGVLWIGALGTCLYFIK